MFRPQSSLDNSRTREMMGFTPFLFPIIPRVLQFSRKETTGPVDFFSPNPRPKSLFTCFWAGDESVSSCNDLFSSVCFSKNNAIRVSFGFACYAKCLVYKNSRHFVNQSKVKPSSFVTRSRDTYRPYAFASASQF